MLASFIKFCVLFLFLFVILILFDKLIYKIKQNRYTAKKELKELKKDYVHDVHKDKDYVHDFKKKSKKSK